MRRKPTRGGARAGAGRPRTTGGGTAKPISFKVSPEVRARAEALAQLRGVKVGALARNALLAELAEEPPTT